MKNTVLKNQHSHWEKTFADYNDMFGEEPSEPARNAVDFFKKNGVNKILELGGGQGRDTIYFARNGFHISVLDYTDAGIEAIKRKAEFLGLSHLITAIRHDVRSPLPFENGIFDAGFSHMLYCMAFTTQELQFLSSEIRRVLKLNGVNIYTVRNTNDKHYGTGILRGEDMYEVNGFIVHFFNREKITLLANGYAIDEISEFEEGDLPRKLFQVISRRT